MTVNTLVKYEFGSYGEYIARRLTTEVRPY